MINDIEAKNEKLAKLNDEKLRKIQEYEHEEKIELLTLQTHIGKIQQKSFEQREEISELLAEKEDFKSKLLQV